jgi:MoaA/NifB/PqqE/SkfB family radical SAM enzyme
MISQNKHNETTYAQVDDEGRVILPDAVRTRLGIEPGSRVHLEEGINGLRIQASSHLAKFYIEPTDECNLGCRTCIRRTWSEPQGKMSEAVFSRVVEGLRAFPLPITVVFGGFGEPLFHPNIVDMVSRVKTLGATVELTTNGTLLSAEISRGLIAAGLDILWVSLDGATPESYADIRLGATFPKVIENVSGFRDFLNYHITIPYYALIPDFQTELGIVFVAMKRNIGELPKVIELGRSLSARHFMVTNVLPYSQDMAKETLYSGALDDCHFSDISLPKADLTCETQAAIFEAIKRVDGVWPGSGRTFTAGKCPFIANGAGAVGWEGSLSPCLALLHSHVTYPARFGQSERSVRAWKIGNLAEQSLKDLWNKPEHIAFREKVQESGFSPCMSCGGCELAEKNEEDCFANEFPTCGACLWAQGVLQCP